MAPRRRVSKGSGRWAAAGGAGTRSCLEPSRRLGRRPLLLRGRSLGFTACSRSSLLEGCQSVLPLWRPTLCPEPVPSGFPLERGHGNHPPGWQGTGKGPRGALPQSTVPVCSLAVWKHPSVSHTWVCKHAHLTLLPPPPPRPPLLPTPCSPSGPGRRGTWTSVPKPRTPHPVTWPWGGRACLRPTRQLRSRASKLETPQADKGAVSCEPGEPGVPVQVCSDYLGGLIKVPCPRLS